MCVRVRVRVRVCVWTGLLLCAYIRSGVTCQTLSTTLAQALISLQGLRLRLVHVVCVLRVRA